MLDNERRGKTTSILSLETNFGSMLYIKNPRYCEDFLFCREEGIRTLETVTRLHAFQACSFNRSDTSLYIESCFWFWKRKDKLKVSIKRFEITKMHSLL